MISAAVQAIALGLNLFVTEPPKTNNVTAAAVGDLPKTTSAALRLPRTTSTVVRSVTAV